MGQAFIFNKKRRTPLTDNNFTHKIIYATLLTVRYNKELYARFNEEGETTFSGIIRKCCRELMAKMSESKLSNQRVAAIVECRRDFVDSLIHVYNNIGIDSVLRTAPIACRSGRLRAYMDDISKYCCPIKNGKEIKALPIADLMRLKLSVDHKEKKSIEKPHCASVTVDKGMNHLKLTMEHHCLHKHVAAVISFRQTSARRAMRQS